MVFDLTECRALNIELPGHGINISYAQEILELKLDLGVCWKKSVMDLKPRKGGKIP